MLAHHHGNAVPHLLHPAGQLGTEELADHLFGGGGADGLALGPAAQHLAQGGGVVGLHMLDHQIIQGAAVQQGLHTAEKDLPHRLVHGVEQNGAAVQQQIAVIGHAVGHGILLFKPVGAAVAGAHIPDVVAHLAEDGGHQLAGVGGGLLGLGRGLCLAGEHIVQKSLHPVSAASAEGGGAGGFTKVIHRFRSGGHRVGNVAAGDAGAGTDDFSGIIFGHGKDSFYEKNLVCQKHDSTGGPPSQLHFA